MGDQYDSEIEGVEGEGEQQVEATYVEPSELVAEGQYGHEYGQPGQQYGEYVEAPQWQENPAYEPEPQPQWQENQAYEPQPEAPYPRSAELQPQFQGEDDRDNPGNFWVQHGTQRDQTHYASEEERQQYEVSAGDEGMMRGGEAFDTQGARPGQWAGSKPGRETFVMDDQGQVYAADQQAEMDRLDAGNPDRDERFHHSSFLAGGDVSGAGEMQARDGTVEVISDRSGHYRPDMEMTGQVVSALEDQGQTAEAIGVELGDKGPGYEGEVRAGAIEVQAYHSDSPDVVASGLTPEQLLRERHGQKDDVLDELRNKMAGRRAELDAAAEGRDINSGDVREELLGQTAGLREGLDAEAEQRAVDVAERQRAIDAEKAAREWEAGREEREAANVARGLSPDGYTN